MSRAVNVAPRPVSLTEELDKLEQSITLTLQEIDHNFSRAHRIVTTSILPIVEKYAEHSNAVWEGSKFWKQFFEASANVSLSGVEEQHDEEKGDEEAQDNDENQELSYLDSEDTCQFTTSVQSDDSTINGGEGRGLDDQADDTLLNNPDISRSTPRNSKPKMTSNNSQRHFSQEASRLESRIESLNQEKGSPGTPIERFTTPDVSLMEKLTSPELTSNFESMMQKRTGMDPLLHRVLDKNYRIQATPHKNRVEAKVETKTESWRNLSSPDSSPPFAAPQLRAGLFSSPVRQGKLDPDAPTTPGISVLTPAKGKFASGLSQLKKKDEISWESDSDEDAEGVYRELGLSPPKTIQFNLPQSRLLQTPAREASQRIVQDLLTTARGGFEFSDQEDSPNIVAKGDLDYSL